MTKNPILQFVIWALLLSHPAYAKEATHNETGAGTEKHTESSEPAGDASKTATVGGAKTAAVVGIGALLAATLSLLGGGSNSTSQHGN